MRRYFKNYTSRYSGTVLSTEPPQCMPDQYKVPDCSITAYWNYYEREKHTVANKNEEFKFRPDEYINVYT